MQTRAAIIYYGSQFWEQVLAVVPITMCLVAVMAIYFQETVNAPAELAGGLIAAMIGLVLFVDGLRVAIMPLGSMLGQQLPEQFKVRYILVVACAMDLTTTDMLGIKVLCRHASCGVLPTHIGCNEPTKHGVKLPRASVGVLSPCA